MINAEVKSYCERLARLAEQKKAIAADEKEIKAEAEAKGYDKSLIAKTVALMLKDGTKRAKALEQHELFDTYLIAAGLLPEPDETPVLLPVEQAKEGEAIGPDTASPSEPIQDTQPDGQLPVASNQEASAGGAAHPRNEPPAPIQDRYSEAVRAVRESRTPSTAFLQNAMGLTYTEAAGYIERMEREQIISAPQHTGKRYLLDDLGDIPKFLDRRKTKPEYTAEQRLGSG